MRRKITGGISFIEMSAHKPSTLGADSVLLSANNSPNNLSPACKAALVKPV